MCVCVCVYVCGVESLYYRHPWNHVMCPDKMRCPHSFYRVSFVKGPSMYMKFVQKPHCPN